MDPVSCAEFVLPVLDFLFLNIMQVDSGSGNVRNGSHTSKGIDLEALRMPNMTRHPFYFKM